MSLDHTESAAPLCHWRTGDRHCKLFPTAGRYCLWHQYWFRVVEQGDLPRSQREEFGAWWEQFQPWGTYAENPGQYWADVEVVWAGVSGERELPVMTSVIERELLLRRAEVRRYRASQEWGGDPWLRITGYPLPPWHINEWQGKIDAIKNNGSFLATKECG